MPAPITFRSGVLDVDCKMDCRPGRLQDRILAGTGNCPCLECIAPTNQSSTMHPIPASATLHTPIITRPAQSPVHHPAPERAPAMPLPSTMRILLAMPPSSFMRECPELQKSHYVYECQRFVDPDTGSISVLPHCSSISFVLLAPQHSGRSSSPSRRRPSTVCFGAQGQVEAEV